MPPKRSVTLKRNVTPKRGPGRPPKIDVKASPKVTNQKKITKTLTKGKATPPKTKTGSLSSKGSPNKLTCSDCNESFSSVVLFKKHQLNCGAQEKVKTDLKKRSSDVRDDIEIISAKMRKKTDEIENDVEIIASAPRKSEDRIQLQAFMSNKVQSLLSSVSPVKNLGLGKASKDTTLWKSKPENSVSISASSLRKNIALSLQKNDLENSVAETSVVEVSKSRRGRKPNDKNQTLNSPAQKSIQSTFAKITSKSNEAAVEPNTGTNVASLNKDVSSTDQSIPSTGTDKSNDTVIAAKGKILSPAESTKTAQELLKTPARRGRPPKRLHEDRIKEAVIEKTKNKTSEIDNTNLQSTKNEVVLASEKEKEKAESTSLKATSVPKRRGRPPKKAVVENTSIDSNKSAGDIQSENELEIEMEIESDNNQSTSNSGIKIVNVESVDVSVKEEDDTHDSATVAKKSKPGASGSGASKDKGPNNKDSKSEVKELSANESAADTPTVFSCAVCQKTFTRKYHLDRHLRISKCSGLPVPSFPCELCNRVYTRKDNLREHLRSHAGEVHRRKKHKCPYCDKAFHGQSLLAIHIRKHTGERPFSCDFCPKKFSSSGALSKHRMTHTGERPYSCNECGRRFTLKGTLSRHLRTHTGIRPHTCPYCGKKFIQIGGLNAHLFYHTGENGFKCDDCGKIFNRKARLQMHQLYVHIKLKPYACDNCPKTFTRKEDLMRHSVLHTGEKPFKCPTCDRRFSVKPSLKLHLLTHTKEEPRSCHECGRAFIRKDCLLRHMRKRHRDVFDKILFDEKDEKDASIVNSRVLSEKDLTDNIRELLYLLIDEPTLIGFGWPNKAVDEVLELVIQRCGHTPVTRENYEYMDRLRENAKLLFTVVIDDNAVKTLLNNQTVDEVILHVLRLAKT